MRGSRAILKQAKLMKNQTLPQSPYATDLAWTHMSIILYSKPKSINDFVYLIPPNVRH
ncbi:hypothetical protein RYX36_025345 [Vicia faba]